MLRDLHCKIYGCEKSFVDVVFVIVVTAIAFSCQNINCHNQILQIPFEVPTSKRVSESTQRDLVDILMLSLKEDTEPSDLKELFKVSFLLIIE